MWALHEHSEHRTEFDPVRAEERAHLQRALDEERIRTRELKRAAQSQTPGWTLGTGESADGAALNAAINKPRTSWIDAKHHRKDKAAQRKPKKQDKEKKSGKRKHHASAK